MMQVFREGKTIEDVKEPLQRLIIERSWAAKEVLIESETVAAIFENAESPEFNVMKCLAGA